MPQTDLAEDAVHMHVNIKSEGIWPYINPYNRIKNEFEFSVPPCLKTTGWEKKISTSKFLNERASKVAYKNESGFIIV